MAQVAEISKHRRRQSSPELLRGPIEKVEQFPGCVRAKDSPDKPMLDDRLSPSAEVTQICEADPIDSRRVKALPAAPDQTRRIE